MYFSFAFTASIIIITLIFIEPQYETFLYGESCYFNFEKTSEFSPYIKAKFCFKYFLWNDVIYCVIIIALSALIIRMIYSETKVEENDKTNNCTLQIQLNKLQKEIEHLQTANVKVIGFKNDLVQLNKLHDEIVVELKNELNNEILKNTELVNENLLLKKESTELQAIYLKNGELSDESYRSI